MIGNFPRQQPVIAKEDNIHSCRPNAAVLYNWQKLWYCVSCDWTGNVWGAVEHAVKKQFRA